MIQGNIEGTRSSKNDRLQIVWAAVPAQMLQIFFTHKYSFQFIIELEVKMLNFEICILNKI